MQELPSKPKKRSRRFALLSAFIAVAALFAPAAQAETPQYALLGEEKVYSIQAKGRAQVVDSAAKKTLLNVDESNPLLMIGEPVQIDDTYYATVFLDEKTSNGGKGYIKLSSLTSNAAGDKFKRTALSSGAHWAPNTDGSFYVYKAASVQGEKAGVVKKGSVVGVIGESGDFYKLLLGSKIVFAKKTRLPSFTHYDISYDASPLPEEAPDDALSAPAATPSPTAAPTSPTTQKPLEAGFDDNVKVGLSIY